MEDLEKCFTFFDDCLSFKAKFKDFEKVCKNIDLDKIDKNRLIEAAKYYAFVKSEMSRICHYEKTFYDTGVFRSDDEMDMDSDHGTDSDTNMDKDSDTDSAGSKSDDTDSDMDTDKEIGGDSDTGDDSDNMSINSEDDDDDDDEILLVSNDCCWVKILHPFFFKMEYNKTAFNATQKEEDRMEDELERMKNWLETGEKLLSAKLFTEVCHQFDEEGYGFIKRCPSLYIKLLVAYCKNIDDDGALEELFGENSDLIIDDDVPLNTKRKIFKDKESITNLITHMKENATPQIRNIIQSKQEKFLNKLS